MRRFIFATAIFLSCAPGGAFADACDEISIASMVAKAQMAADNSCNFGGPEWSTDPNVQRQVCNMERDEAWYGRRDTALSLCMSCRGYANTAMKSVATATALHCAFLNKSEAWQTTAAEQYQSCLINTKLIGGYVSIEYILG